MGETFLPSNRKPHNWFAGYVAERKVKHPFGGHIIILDRDNGGEWVDGGERWVLLWEPVPESINAQRFGPRIVEMSTRENAYSLMKSAAANVDDFCWFVCEDEAKGARGNV